jgi:hypothetical protein
MMEEFYNKVVADNYVQFLRTDTLSLDLDAIQNIVLYELCTSTDDQEVPIQPPLLLERLFNFINLMGKPKIYEKSCYSPALEDKICRAPQFYPKVDIVMPFDPRTRLRPRSTRATSPY